MLDLQGSLAWLEAHHPAPRHEFQRAIIIELRRPTHGDLNRPAGEEYMLGSEENASAADIDRLPLASFLVALFIQHAVAYVALYREAP